MEASTTFQRERVIIPIFVRHTNLPSMTKLVFSFRVAVAMLTILGTLSCSRPSSDDASRPTVAASAERSPSAAEIQKLYDPSLLIEVKTLSEFPEDLKTVIGVHETGYARIADVGEECNPTDVIGNTPGRCFFVGGLSNTGALVSFKVGGYAGQSGIATSYIRFNSKWTQVRHWTIGYPNSLNELREMTSFSPDSR